ncbi:MAG TPA: hypothetical protein VJI12_00155 [archaeon]|nr:hypothetical protein [archaeon]
MRAVDLSADIRRLMTPKLSKDFSGPSPGIFVGSENYPNLNVGPLGMLADVNDNPADWLNMNYQQIIAIRGSMIRSGRKENVRSTQKIVDNMQEISVASRPTDVEMIFQKRPTFSMSFDSYVQPMGPFARLESLRLQENPRVDVKVEKILGDELKASEAAMSLYLSDNDVYKITTILSSGVLGFDKKLVPTRWSITATDDIITKALLRDVRTYASINDFLIFESFQLDNHFLILLMPGMWEFEDFEAWSKGSAWKPGLEVEYEPFTGRTAYAEQEGGGYYAARIGVVEYLHHVRRQARVIVFREIHEGYSVPLGVWQVRENVRNAMSRGPVKFDTMASALAYLSKKLRHPLAMYTQKSRVLSQRRLTDF